MGWIYFIGIIAIIIGLGAFFGAPYVPTRRKDLQRMFDELYPLSKDDVLLDFGSGDGLVLREASRRKAKAVGFEINPVFWAISKVWSWNDKNVKAQLCNGWITPFPENVTVIYAFAVMRDGNRLIKKLQKETDKLQRPLLMICYGNPIPGLKPVRTYEAYALYEFRPLHLKEA